MSPIHHDQFDINLEHQHISEHRQRYGLEKNNEYSALAISGGGVRSASFALGVMQGLVSANIMKNIDYLCTASGGGYIGSTLTWLLNQINASHPEQPANVEAGSFPLGRVKAGSNGNNAPDANAELDFIRHHSSYLTPTKALNNVSLLAVILRSSFVSITTYFVVLSALIFIFVCLGAFEPVRMPELPDIVAYNWFSLLAVVMIFSFAIGSFTYAVFTRMIVSESLYKPRTKLQSLFGHLISYGVIALILASIPFLHTLFIDLGAQWHCLYAEKGFAGLSTFLGFVMGVIQFFRLRKGCTNDTRSQLLIFGSAIFLIYGLFFSAYLLDITLIEHNHPLSVVGLFLMAGIFGLYINTNYISLHRMYRDRLMECYLPNLESIKQNIWGYATVADSTGLEKMCQHPNQRPYHIINTNLVLSSSKKVQYHARGGDSFILSPLLCGSSATGWVRTTHWLKDNPSTSTGMTLATAMAASGASVNPNAGNNSRGLARTRLISIVLSLLNVRLGIWATNPRFHEIKLSKPAFITTLFKSSNENNPQIELSDGGHFDNLAIYELIRRRVNIVIASDAGADKHFVFDDLGNCIEKVRVDFNVNIRFDDAQFTLDNLQPGSAEASQREIIKYGLAKNGFAIATIEYPPSEDQSQGPSYGTLIYIKATVIPELPVDVINYKASHPDFPHEPTSDQFFNEIQFEAYRELGYRITKNMVKDCKNHAWLNHFNRT